MVHSVRGMGGVGKTQLATEFVHAHAADYDLVYWITAEELPAEAQPLAERALVITEARTS